MQIRASAILLLSSLALSTAFVPNRMVSPLDPGPTQLAAKVICESEIPSKMAEYTLGLGV